MPETLVAAGIVAMVSTLWRLSTEHAGMRVSLEKGIAQVVEQISGLRTELRRDVNRLETVLEDHEHRIRNLEKD
jgi:hypothetical protein